MTQVKLPWGKWTEREQLTLDFPADWVVEVLSPSLPPPMEPPQLQSLIEESLGQLSGHCRQVCIVVEDPARPTNLGAFLKLLIGAIRSRYAGCGVSLLVASGCHVWHDQRMLRAKYGEAIETADQFSVHDADGPTVDAGLALGPVSVKLNPIFLSSDCRILVGSVVPHPFAGFSGGAKLILPGIADRTCTEYTHKMVRLGGDLGPNPAKNRFRQRIEPVAQQLGIDLCFCLLPAASGEICDATVGDVIAAHHAACERAASYYHVRVQGPYDAVILNAYPKDMDLIQSRAALAALPRKLESVIRTDGVVVLCAAAPLGSAGHGLFSPGGSLYTPPRRDGVVGPRTVFVLTDAPEDDTSKVFSGDYCVLHDPVELSKRLAGHLGHRARVAVLPCAPLTRLVCSTA